MTASLSSNLGLLAFLLASSLLVAESLAKESRETTRSPPKAKKSAEDIMFGNQQNKPAGMVDDLLTSLPERDAGEPKSQTRNQTRPADHANPTNATTDKRKRDRGDEKSDSEKSSSNKESSDERGASLDSRKFDYYDYLQEADESRLADPGVEGYRLESIEERNSKATGTTAGDASSANLPADGQTYNQRELGDYPEEDYDGVLYRRKRTPRRTPMAGSSSFTRQRSVRSNLDDLLAGNGGRRALRLKRDVGVERFLAWLDALSHRQQPQQLGQQREDDPNETELGENEETPSEIPLSFFYDPKMAGNNDWYNPNPTPEEDLEEAVFPPGFLESALTRELTEDEERTRRPDWTKPGYPLLSRRSPPPTAKTQRGFGYPLDYRYLSVPGQKKKRQGIRIRDTRRSNGDETGKWGQFPIRGRKPLRDDPDPDTLYALASLLAEDAPAIENDASQELDRRRRNAPKPFNG